MALRQGILSTLESGKITVGRKGKQIRGWCQHRGRVQILAEQSDVIAERLGKDVEELEDDGLDATSIIISGIKG